MNCPTERQQLEFLGNVQRVLAEGQFTATYKFALLMALADLSIELGDDSGDSLEIPSRVIAEKFIEYYWRQAAPYEGSSLSQNTGRSAAVLNKIESVRSRVNGSLYAAKRNREEWRKLITAVNQTVRDQPLWKLQTLGSQRNCFFYQNEVGADSITLLPGVASCFRKFHAVVSDLVQAGWVKYIRQHNKKELGASVDLHEFLFGAERSSLAAARTILRDIQKGACFYCRRTIQDSHGEVDHFVPWARYPLDLGHNFVLAHAQCNRNKSDTIAAEVHLEKWVERNSGHGLELAAAMQEHRIICDLDATRRIARWAYSQTASTKGLTWMERKTLVPLGREWEALFADQPA